MYNGVKIQMLDLPGIIEGAAQGKGRGKQVISAAKNSDLVLMVLDAGKEGLKQNHKQILERELETVGLRLNKRPPDIALHKTSTGGIKFNSTVPLTKLGIFVIVIILSLFSLLLVFLFLLFLFIDFD